MTHGEIMRRIVTTFFYLSVLSFLLLRNSTSFDHTEGETLAQMAIVVIACETLLWASMRRLRARWYVAAAGAALILLALTCTHEVARRLWISVAHIPGETDRQWFERAALVAAEEACR